MTLNALAFDSYSIDDPESEERLRRLLDRTAERLRALDTNALDDLILGLNAARLDRLPGEWDSLVTRIVAPHMARMLVQEDPLTDRAFKKPRGYPGDAALIDLIYREVPLPSDVSRLGRRIYEYATEGPASISVRERRQIIATLIDSVALERQRPRILSLACGHLREAQNSAAVRGGAIEELVAVDQDQHSLNLVAREHATSRVTPVRASIRRILIDPTIYGDFDLIYAAGLYDYLDDVVAQRLTASLFAALRSGGTLFVGNFAPNLRDIGYMEAMMDWKLIYRDDASVARLAAQVPAGQVTDCKVTRDSKGNVVYLTLSRC